MKRMIAMSSRPASESTPMVASAFSRLLGDYLQSRIGKLPQLAQLMAQAPRGSVARTHWFDLLTEMTVQLNEPDLPLQLGASLQIRHLGIAGHVLMTCDTLGEAAEHYCRYCRLVGDMGYTRIHRLGTVGEATFHWDNDDIPPPALEQIWAASIVTLSQWLTGRQDLVWEFHFRHPRPTDISAYERMLGPQLHFGQQSTRNIFPPWMMDLPVSTHIPEMRPLAEAQAAASLRALQQDADLVQRVSSLIADQLTKGTATVGKIAPQLALSTRTLNRRLTDVGTSFRALSETVRRTRAESLLLNPAVSLAEVSFMLGYHEQSTFQRAFKRWTGMTPGEFRASRLHS